RALASALGLARTWLANDLEATAWGVTVLPETSLVTLNTGTREAQGSAAVIAAGTGLGMAGRRWGGAGREPHDQRGGHPSVAPRAWLARRFGHVSWERVLSGQGIVHCYEFLRDTGAGEEPATLATALKTGDPAAAITKAAATVPLCAAALDLFVGLYGAAA